MHVLIKEGFKLIGPLVIWGIAGIVHSCVGKDTAHVCCKYVQRKVVVLLLETLLHESKIHGILQAGTMLTSLPDAVLDMFLAQCLPGALMVI